MLDGTAKTEEAGTMDRSFGVVVLSVVLAALAVAGPGLAQTESYAVTHPFALATATTTRLFGMGGFITCIEDEGFGNPAFAGTLRNYSAVGRYSVTDYDHGLKLKGEQVSVAIPLKKNAEGLQVTGFRLTSDAGLLAGPPPSNFSCSEYDVSIHYGRRLSDAWVVGIAMSPVFHNSTSLTAVGTGVPLLQLRSEADEGCRLGVLYEFGDRGQAGAVYDKYHEDVTATGLAIGGGPLYHRYTSEEMVAGVSWRFNDRILGALEWQQLTTEGAGIKIGDSGVRVGIEAMVSDNCAVRLGSNDGSLSAGIGFAGNNWTLQYAYIDDWNDDTVGATLGDSSTHQLEATYAW
jgi:hypothetical protein